ncbi:hypothetical protein QZM15_32970 [Burkholderia sp. AU44665]|uniref:hypothetical protein n=1 Tax=Burkholderia sp. AU44665 TaxID=3059203 RepID=UPI00265F61F2|nr:hypothetical protein [Burkholderia sp. AU44665]MDN7703299.1 hypothetical protein [Burkholderia sp. AU44665]
MNEIKHTPLVADNECVCLEDGALIATVWVKYPDEARLDGESWLDMRNRTAADRELAEITAKNRAKEFAAASDAILALEMIAAEDDAARERMKKPLLTSGVRAMLDSALIKAGRKAAPEPVRGITINGGVL